MNQEVGTTLHRCDQHMLKKHFNTILSRTNVCRQALWDISLLKIRNFYKIGGILKLHRISEPMPPTAFFYLDLYRNEK